MGGGVISSALTVQWERGALDVEIVFSKSFLFKTFARNNVKESDCWAFFLGVSAHRESGNNFCCHWELQIVFSLSPERFFTFILNHSPLCSPLEPVNKKQEHRLPRYKIRLMKIIVVSVLDRMIIATTMTHNQTNRMFGHKLMSLALMLGAKSLGPFYTITTLQSLNS